MSAMCDRTILLDKLRYVVMSVLSACMWFATSSLSIAQCTDAEIWGVFPTTAEAGGVNEQLRNDSKSIAANGDRFYDRQWGAGSSSRSLMISLTCHVTPGAAKKRVDDYGSAGSGVKAVAIGDGGYWTDSTKRPYYLVHRGNISISLSSRRANSGYVGPQDHLLKKMIKKIDALPCMTGIPVHKITLNGPTAGQNPIASGGTASLSASATDSEQGHTLIYAWVETSQKGNFGTPKVARTTWTAPSNTTARVVEYEISCTVTCKGGKNSEMAGNSLKLLVLPQGREVEFTALPTAGKGLVAAGSKVPCSATAKCNLGHAPVTYAWKCTSGSFVNPAVQNPIWQAPAVAAPKPVTHTLTCTAKCTKGAKCSATVKQQVGEGLVLKVDNPAKSIYIMGDEIVLPGTLTFAGQPVDGANIQVAISTSTGNTVGNAGTVSGRKGTFTVKHTIKLSEVGPKDPETWTITVVADAPDPKLKPISTTLTVTVHPIALKLHDVKLVQVVELPEKGSKHVTFGKPLYARVYLSCPSLKDVKGVPLPKVTVQLSISRGQQSANIPGYPVTKIVEVGSDVVEVDFLPSDLPLTSPGIYGVSVVIDPDGTYTKPTLSNSLTKSDAISVRRVKPLKILIVPLSIDQNTAEKRTKLNVFYRERVSFMRDVYPQKAGEITAHELGLQVPPCMPILPTTSISYFMMARLSVLGYMLGYDRVVGVGAKSAHWWWQLGLQPDFPYILKPIDGMTTYIVRSALVKYGASYEVFAHEIGHTFGLNRGTEEYEALPDNGAHLKRGLFVKNGVLGDFAKKPDLDASFGKWVKAVTCFMGRSIDCMNYPGWVCQKTYTELFAYTLYPHTLRTRNSAKISKSVLLIGKIDPIGNVTLDATYSGTVLPEVGQKGDFTVECMSANDQQLSSVCFGVDAGTTQRFDIVIPFPGDTVSIQFRNGTRILKTLTPGKSAPVVKVLSPNGGEYIGDTMTVTWSATDADGDALTYSVFYSADAGTTWGLLAMHEKGTSLKTSFKDLPGGSRCLVKVVAHDGFNLAEDTSDTTFSATDRPPLLSIISPTNGMTIATGTTQTTHVVAYDLEEGPLSATGVTWHSDRDGNLGQAAAVSLGNLSVGSHRLTASITDAGGRTGKAVATVNVAAGVQRIEVAVGEQITLRTPREAEIYFGSSTDPAGADIHLRYANRRPLAMRFEGRWVALGSPPAYGTLVNLKALTADRDTRLWKFNHSLRPGGEINAYILQDGVWQQLARIVCRP